VPWDEGAPGLTGLSHGAAGVGYALLELHRVTRSEPFRATALAAFKYERGLFDPEAGNWLDLSGGSDPEERRFLVAWCHGAPGIALTRLRALDLLDDAGCRADAVAGTRTTREEVRAGLATGSGNYSLCHGLAGNAEILLHARDVLGGAWEAERTLALEVAEAGIERHGATGRWPSGLRGEAPGLMLGLAGTALFYLRLHDPSVPSVLLPGSLAGG
jgi:class II lanthipeptide synthase